MRMEGYARTWFTPQQLCRSLTWDRGG